MLIKFVNEVKKIANRKINPYKLKMKNKVKINDAYLKSLSKEEVIEIKHFGKNMNIHQI